MLAQQGKITGFIRPPPDIRVIVDKTAGFVAKHGEHMEAKIMDKEAGNSKFGFLKQEDPYHAYYRHKVQEIRTGVSVSEAAPAAAEVAEAVPAPVVAPAPPAPAGVTAVQRGGASCLPNPLSRALQSFDPARPVKDVFTLPVPAGESALGLETIKLTAQFTAAGGKDFLRQLSAREFRNPTFDFLRPNNALFGYFTALVDAYSRVVHANAALKERVEAAAASGFPTLERGVHRLEFARSEESKMRAAEVEAASAAAAAAAIDWHDFVIVESIAFPIDEDLTALDLGEEVAEAKDSEGAEEDVDMDTEEGGASGAKLNIRYDFVPAAGVPTGVAAPTHFMDPRTGQLLPIGNATEHMRIDLLDPRWKEDKERAAAKQAHTNLLNSEQVSENLRRLAASRGDVFRGDGGPDGSGGSVVAAGPSSVAGGQAKRPRQAE
jgi:splicing factor 3A subunit 1